MENLSKEERSTCVLLSLFYGGVLLLSIGQLFLLQRRKIAMKTFDTRRAFRVMSFVVCLLRTIYLIFTPYTFESNLPHEKRFLELFFPRITTLIYFSAYMILVVVWARLFYSIQESDPNTLSKIKKRIDQAYILVNVLLYLLESGFLFLFLFGGANDDDISKYYTLLTANTLFTGLLMMFWGIGFMWFGLLIFIKVRHFAAHNFLRTRELVYQKLRKVSFITIICTICFLCRAALICFYTTRDKLQDPPEKYWILYLFNALIGEIIPMALVLTQASSIKKEVAEKPITAAPQITGAYFAYEDSDGDLEENDDMENEEP